MASTYLTRTQTAGNRKTWTFSVWCKRANLASDQELFKAYTSANDYLYVRFNSNNDMYMESSTGGSSKISFTTNRKFRDCNAYYHIVLKVDMTQATSTDRWKLYINGVDEATIGGYSASSYASQNDDLAVNLSGATMYIGSSQTPSEYFDGVMSHVQLVDGTAYEASTFGSTDATTGEWKINTSPTITMGTNGFTILKDGNTITDQSSNSNNFTLGAGTLTNTEDCPDDVFATLNPLAYASLAGGTLSNGNNTWVTGNTYYTHTPATLGISKGKFYWEIEYDAKSGGLRYPLIGITSNQATATTQELGHFVHDWAFYASDTTPYYRTNNTNTSYGTIYTEGDVVCVALDADNSKLYFRINGGSWENSGDPTSGATGTGAISITAPSSTPLGAYFPAIAFYDGSNNATFKANFGNGYFGTTAISSEGTNASGIGKFEYDVPTGYTALSTKGLNA